MPGETADAGRAAAWLSPLWPLYAAAVAARGALYDAGWLRAARAAAPVISIGNLTAGGSGKSPMAAWAASAMARRGLRPAVVSRGYGGSYAGRAAVVSAGDGPLLDAAAAGDEPVMLARRLPGVPVIVARRRRDGAALACARFASRCIILDDGFQHRALARDLDIVMIDADDPFGNGRLLPAGPLREPLSALRRAGALVAHRAAPPGAAAGPPGADAGIEAARRHCPGVPLFHAVSRPAALLDPAAGEELPLETLRGETVVCVAGIARPSRFFQAAAAAGARVAAALPFPDHHPYSAADLSAVAERAGREKGAIVLITEKDLARLPREAAARLPRLRALLMETLVEEGPAFTALLERAAS